MGDWLGTGNIAPQLRGYRSFEEARNFARSLGFKTNKEWKEFCKGNRPNKGVLPPDIPAAPYKTYGEEGWVGWGDWLNTDNVATFLRHYRSFEKARAFARSLFLRSSVEWTKFCKGNMPEKGLLPPDIPASPRKTYANKGWNGFVDWLGTGRTRVSKSAKRKS